MISRRGFRIVGTPRASSGSVRFWLSLPGESRPPFINEGRRWRRIALPQHERAPPEPTRVAQGPSRTTRPQRWHWASGGRRQPRQTKLHPNRLRNGVSCDFSHYIGSRSMQEPRRPF
jgi:hypothetical protein